MSNQKAGKMTKKQVNTLLFESKKLIEKNQIKRALEKLNEILEIGNHEKNIEGLNLKAYCLKKQHQLSEAQELLQNARKFDEKNVLTNYNIACNFLENQEYQEAIKYFEEVDQIGGEDCKTQYNIGFCFEKLGELEEAKEYYQKSIKLSNYEWGKPVLNCSALLIKENKVFQAQKMLEQYLEKCPDDCNALNNLSLTIVQTGSKKFEDLQQIFEKILKMKPNNTEFLFNYAVMNYKLGNLQVAVKAFREIESTDKKGKLVPLSLINQGLIHAEVKEYLTAKKCFARLKKQFEGKLDLKEVIEKEAEIDRLIEQQKMEEQLRREQEMNAKRNKEEQLRQEYGKSFDLIVICGKKWKK